MGPKTKFMQIELTTDLIDLSSLGAVRCFFKKGFKKTNMLIKSHFADNFFQKKKKGLGHKSFVF